MIIGIAGKMGVGKDTVANHLVENYGFKKLAFADNLKKMCMNTFNLSEYDCYSEEGKFKPFNNKLELTSHHVENIVFWIEDINNMPEVSEEQKTGLYSLVGTKFETPRHLLQFIGTDMLRKFVRDDFHAEVIYQKIMTEKLDNVAISDARFENERDKIKMWGGKTLIVTGRDTEQNASDSSKSHASENSLGAVSEYDYHIHNADGLEELYSKINKIMRN